MRFVYDLVPRVIIFLFYREKAGLDVSVAIMIQYQKSETNARDKLLQLIQECYAITGESDFLLRVYYSSIKELSQLLNETFQKSYISGMHSYMLTECLKDSYKMPIKKGQS